MSVFAPNIMNRNLSGFRFNEFTLKHFRIHLISSLKLCNISPNIFPQGLNVLSSAKLNMSDFETQNSISFIKMLNNKGLRTDPYSIPQIIS